tara:strand:+ start:160 stop:465 length:306 start_codon:yes stop_codon:yes gene_type:complete
MSELIKAIKGLPPIKPKVHTVNIQGQSVVVSLKKKLEVMQHGEDAYHWVSAIEFALKPKPKKLTKYPTLQKSSKGYIFQDGDVHWPTSITEEGYAWRRKPE